MRFDVITVLPAMFQAVTAAGVVGRANGRGLWQLNCWNPRDYAADAYRTVDDRPYGGGPGMVMMAEPLAGCLRAIAVAQSDAGLAKAKVVFLSPQGKRLDQARIMSLKQESALTLLCGRYEGVDQRLIDAYVDEELSVGDLVVSGGELPAMLLIDAIVRQLPGALNDDQSALQESFAAGLLDFPHYTRPEGFDGQQVPQVLLSGHHAAIAAWRREQALSVSLRKRPELIALCRQQGLLSSSDETVLAKLAGSSGVEPV
jgi:tRNA (guanine37-N1)-methyltransferase